MPTDDAATDVLIQESIDWHARGLGNSFRGIVWNEGLTCAILKKGRVEDERTWRQLREFF